MTRSAEDVRRALELASAGCSQAAISRTIGASRATVATWLAAEPTTLLARRAERECLGGDACVRRRSLDPASYAYLLGLYLGDGCISVSSRGVARLRIMCCDQYPQLIERCVAAMATVKGGGRVGRTQCQGCTEVRSDSRHWPCLFPQHGPGRKHERPIELAPWQQEIVSHHPGRLVEGLIHSDGCRITNRVRSHGRTYAYPRYLFSNVSSDIRRIFCDACDALGVEWRQNRWNSISVARRASVALLDQHVPPKS